MRRVIRIHHQLEHPIPHRRQRRFTHLRIRPRFANASMLPSEASASRNILSSFAFFKNRLKVARSQTIGSGAPFNTSINCSNVIDCDNITNISH
jgi:hypothetical protein